MTKLEQAYYYIEKNQIADFFTFLNNNAPSNSMLIRLGRAFVYGKTDIDFDEQLKVLASMLLTNTQEKEETKNLELQRYRNENTILKQTIDRQQIEIQNLNSKN